MAGILLLTVSATHAAGLGKLTVASALGQPLRAEIDLVSVQKDELASLTARLASPDAFKQAELEYTAALASVKVSVEKRANGQPYIKLTSSQPIEEPILDVLIELSWASGRLVREYTALMDPPEYNAPAVAPVAKPETQVGPKPAAAAKTKPSGRISRTVEPAREAGAGDGSGGSYSVKSGDTLVKIARSNKVEGVSLEQMLVGLYQNNREAFADNMNRLKSGKILRIPERETLAAIEPDEAVQEVKVQAANWNAYRQKLAAAAQAATPADAAAQSATGRINATVEDQAAVTEPGREVLRLSKGEQNISDQSSAGSAGAGGADRNGSQERLRALEEEATAREKALQEANERIALLEGNVKSMQRLLEIKNESLAQAQNQANATNQPEPAANASTPASPAVADANAPAGTDAVAAAPAPTPAPETNPVQSQAAQAEGQAAAPVVAGDAPVAVVPAEEPDIIARVLDKPLYLAVGVLVLALIAFAVMRRRRSQPEFENSIMTGGDLTGNTVFGDSSGGVVDTSDGSLISDFSKVGLEHISTDEVDPLAEAEVYIAYGRDAQAEEILKEAINRNPQRYEIHLKLLEIYAMRQSLGAFETLAGELYAATDGQGEVWSKAAELGRSLDPGNPLYASAQPVEANPPTDAQTQDFVQDESIDQATRSEFDFNSDPLTRTAMNFDAALDQDRKAEAGIQFRSNEAATMDFEVAPIEETDKPIEAAAAPDSMIDFDFDLGAPETRANTEDDAITLRAVEEEEQVQRTGQERETVEVPVHEKDHDAAASRAQAGELSPLTSAFELDFPRQETGDRQATGDGNEQDRKDVPNVAVHTDLSTIDLNFDSARTAQERVEAPVARNDQWYDVQTKFDLAKAYQEMGDKEGAREILQEVVQEGDAEQQANSKALLASLG
ncbi:MAG: FimV family protein [Burkholderiales bacterium]|nr:FimV family protein [Burkholderiales bacterium]